MDNTTVCSNSRNTIRTDLSLLLECLKFQMKCPDLQKQALLTIHSICEKREDNVDLLRDMGGVAFVYNLSKSSIVRADVKETALFTLGTLAEANVSCKSSLCRKETFADLADWLTKEDITLTKKRVTVYFLSVLVANYKLGQTLAQTTGCLDILLDLFRTTFPHSTEATSRPADATQTYQLWSSVSSALCGCVNNPQNEEGQRMCVAAFPIIKIWLQQIALPQTEIFQPICSFIAMAVANNSCVQESFSASGGLETLTLALVRFASEAETSLLACQLSVSLSKTLSACITDNSALASGLVQYEVVYHLLSLLMSPNLDPEDRLSALLTLGHCTEASEEHQNQLVQCGGLPLIITFLTEDTSEVVRKAATFILQTCKQATHALGVPVFVRQDKVINMKPPMNMEGFRSSARELLQRIDLLKKRQAEEEQEITYPATLTKEIGQSSLPPALALLPQQESRKNIPKTYKQSSTLQNVEAEEDNLEPLTVRRVIKNQNNSEMKNTSSSLSCQEDKTKASGGDVWCSVCKGAGVSRVSQVQRLEGDRESKTVPSQLFKPPAAVKQNVPKEVKCTDEEELHDSEMSKGEKIPVEEHSLSAIRCAGCVLRFEELNSRTFAPLQSTCIQSCDMHKVLQEATERFRTHHRNLLVKREHKESTLELINATSENVAAEPQRNLKYWSEVCLTPVCKETGQAKRSQSEHHWKKHHGIRLTPLQRRPELETLISGNTTGPRFAPLKRPHPSQERRAENTSENLLPDDQLKTSRDPCCTRRKRKDFTHEEQHYLLCGVKKYGLSWNTILWAYPFQPGRTNVDLAKKYKRLMNNKAPDSVLP